MNIPFSHTLAFFCAVLLPFSLKAEAPSASPTPRAELKLLTIGNSFADCSTNFLPAFAKAGGKKLTLFKANLGGRSLDQHVSYLKAYETNPDDPKGSPYKATAVVDSANPAKHGTVSLKAALQSQPWDVVTIQQVSHKSYKPETYEPYAGILVDYIKKNAPGAEIVVHETWAYGNDALVGFNAKKNLNLTQMEMYTGLKAAYTKLASHYGFRVLPVGDAFQQARAEGIVVNLPNNIHANDNGDYIGAAIWYEMLFHDNAENVDYVPAKMEPEMAKKLRHLAHEAVIHSDFKLEPQPAAAAAK